MIKFTKKDLFFSIITGLTTGVIAWRVFVFLGVPEFGYGSKFCLDGDVCFWSNHISTKWLVLAMPFLWILGVNLGYILGRWLAFFNQFGKFAAIGFTNAAVYFGVLNLFIFWSEVNKGLWYSIFVAAAFIIGTVHSYFWNKYWVFEATRDGVSGEEFGKFVGVSVVAGLINVGAASILVNFVNPMFGLSLDQWANIGGVVGSAIALVFSFLGFKLTVFHK